MIKRYSQIQTVLVVLLILVYAGNGYSQSGIDKSHSFQKAREAEIKNHKSETRTPSAQFSRSAVSPVNDTICGAIELILNAPMIGDNTALANVSDASDALATTAGYSVSTPNNTLWYYYTAPTSDSVSVLFGGPAGNNELWGWCGEFTATSCAGPLTYIQYIQNGTQYSGNTTISKMKLTAGTTYYFMVDGVVGSTGLFLIGINSVTSGINEFEKNIYSLTVYPNPANDLVTINYDLTKATQMDIQLLDVTGRNVYSENFLTSKKGLKTVNVKDLSNGVYILKLSNSTGNISRKVLIQH